MRQRHHPSVVWDSVLIVVVPDAVYTFFLELSYPVVPEIPGCFRRKVKIPACGVISLYAHFQSNLDSPGALVPPPEDHSRHTAALPLAGSVKSPPFAARRL